MRKNIENRGTEDTENRETGREKAKRNGAAQEARGSAACHEANKANQSERRGNRGTVRYTPSREDYLIAIYLLKKERGSVRSIDVAQMLGVSKPSVFKGTHFLLAHGMIEMNEQKFLYLTEAGEAQAMEIYRRYEIVRDFLRGVLLVSEETAHDDACRLEHIVSAETLRKMEYFLKMPKKHGK